VPAPSASPASIAKAIPDLSRDATRQELTPAALEGILRLAEIWRLSSGQASALLGDISEREWFKIKDGARSDPLSQETLTRISALIGIYKGLHLLFSEPLTDEWVRRPNSETLFGGLAPVDYMIAGGLRAMLETRGYIDSLRGGL
jgi:hypothetical protein